MSCTILYPLLLLVIVCHCTSEVQQEEKGLQTDGTEHLNVEESGAGLTSGEFQQPFLTGIHTELAELRSSVRSLKNRLEVTEEHLRRKGNPPICYLTCVMLTGGKSYGWIKKVSCMSIFVAQ